MDRRILEGKMPQRPIAATQFQQLIPIAVVKSAFRQLSQVDLTTVLFVTPKLVLRYGVVWPDTRINLVKSLPLSLT